MSLGNVLEGGIQGIILTGGRGLMGSGGDDPSMGNLGWFQVVAPTTHWAIPIVTRMIPCRTAFFIAYEIVVFVHMMSLFDQG